MSYSDLFSRAAKIAFRHPWLWVLGFFAALSTQALELFSPNFDPSAQSIGEVGEILAQQLTRFALFAPASVLLQLLAEGSLIAGVRQIGSADDPGIGHALRVGLARFPRLLLLVILLGLPAAPFFAAAYLVGFPNVLVLVEAAVGGEQERLNEALGGLALSIGIVCLVAPYLLFATGVLTLGQRAVVLEDRGALAALRHGARVLLKKLLPVLGLAILLFVINILAGILLALVVDLPLGIIAGLALEGADLALVNEAVSVLSLITQLVHAVLLAPLATYFSTIWTLAYGELTRAVTEVPATSAPYPSVGP